MGKFEYYSNTVDTEYQIPKMCKVNTDSLFAYSGIVLWRCELFHVGAHAVARP